MTPIQILIVDDHPLLREALRSAIEDEADMLVIGEATNGQEALDLLQNISPDVILLDLLMPIKGGVETAQEILTQNPQARILVLTSSGDQEQILRSVQTGVLGYIMKDAERQEVLYAIRQVFQGNAYLPPQVALRLITSLRNRNNRGPEISEERLESLTQRERAVLRLIGRGASNSEISNALFISEGTVRTHVHHMLHKLGIANRNQAILYAQRIDEIDKNN
ncbi:MAG TPA: response regulator transcription factor [Anaerolineaceae bacterium]|nr:response regulator transcription factor [Anaerolineaceae bacterium]